MRSASIESDREYREIHEGREGCEGCEHSVHDGHKSQRVTLMKICAHPDAITRVPSEGKIKTKANSQNKSKSLKCESKSAKVKNVETKMQEPK